MDEDCDTFVDDGAGAAYYADGDGDGSAAIGAPAAGTACSAPTGSSFTRTDCDDTSAAIRVGAPELCDAIDQDCDGAIDDAPGCPRMIYMTTGSYPANGGIAGMVAACNGDPGHPGGLYRALLWAPTRYPCTTPNCSGADVPMDWVIAPSTAYRTRAGTIFTSDAEGLILYPMMRAIDPRPRSTSGWAPTPTGPSTR